MLLFNFIIALCLEMDLIFKMKYKLCCVFFQLFFHVKKHNYKGNPCQNFQFCSHTGPRFQFFEAFFVAAPPSNKEERGENFWENIGSVVNTFGDCPTTIWQTVIGWWWWYWCHCTASQCHDDGDGDDDGDDDAQCVNGWSKWIVLENKTLHFKMV